MLGLPEGVRRANLESGGVPRLTGGTSTPSMTWRDLEWLVAHTELPIIGKGILHPEDARFAVEAGLQAVYVSNHGGRNLDTSRTQSTAFGRSRRLSLGRVPVLLDGGIRRGTDVLKALALGADAVLIGRPYVWGLAAARGRGREERRRDHP